MHTPGPWTAHKVLPHSKLNQPEPDNYVTAGPFDWPGNRVVAAVHHVDGSDGEVNARLIAAAPDMLAALQRIADCCEKEPDCTCYNCGKLALAAIAKAEKSCRIGTGSQK